MKTRNQIDNKYKWDLTQIYKQDDDAKTQLKELAKYVEVVADFKGKLGDKSQLKKFFTLSSDLGQKLNKLGVYVFLKRSEDLEVQKYIEIGNQIDALSNKFSVAQAFVESEILSLDESHLQELIADPNFANNRFYLQDLMRNKPHVLSTAEETLVAKTGRFSGEFSEIFDNIDAVDLKFENVLTSSGKSLPLSNSNYKFYLENFDRVLRKNTFNSLFSGYKSLQNTIATNYIASVKKDVAYNDIYKFKNSLTAALFGNNIDEIVYKNLIENVNANTPLLHTYFRLRKKALNVPSLHYYDINVSLNNIKKSFSYEKSFEVLKQALSPLGKDYLSLLDKCVKERWLDVFPNKNKTTGAYSCDLYGVHPYVLLNTVDNLDSIFTLAHELGHAFHSYHSDNAQPYEVARYPIFLAEIASTTNEILLIKHFLNTTNNADEKIYFLDKYITMFKSTLFRQTMFSEFEQHAHELVENDEPISKEILNKYYLSLNKKYHGPALEGDDIAYEWLRIPHFYRSFYVYKYATGITSAIVLASNILNKSDGVEKYIEFLSSGGSDYPTEILKTAGVDLTKNEPFNIAFGELNWAITELKKLIK